MFVLLKQIFKIFVTSILFKGSSGVFEEAKFPLFIIDLFGDFELRYDVVLFMCAQGKSLLLARE